MVGWETGEERDLFHGEVREDCPEEERSRHTLNDGRKIWAMFQAKGTASARDPKADRSLVWLRDRNQACKAQMRTNDEAEEGAGSLGHRKKLGLSKCDGSHWKVLSWGTSD